MKHEFSPRFVRSYDEAPAEIRRLFDKQLGLLLADIRHSSLRAKKYDEARGIWQARVSRTWRFYFKINGDTYYLLDIIPHPK